MLKGALSEKDTPGLVILPGVILSNQPQSVMIPGAESKHRGARIPALRA